MADYQIETFIFPTDLQYKNSNPLPFTKIVFYDWKKMAESQVVVEPVAVFFMPAAEQPISEVFNHNWDEGLDVNNLTGVGIAGLAKKGLSVLDQALGGYGSAILAGKTGTIVNDMVALQYKNLNLRQFMANYRLIPRNEDDAKQIESIINKLLELTTTKYDQAVVKFPRICQFSSYSGESRLLSKSELCGVSNIQLNPAPDKMRILQDGRILETNLLIEFRELRRRTLDTSNAFGRQG